MFVRHRISADRTEREQEARLTKTNRSVVLAALSGCGIPKNGRNRTHPGQLPFGYDNGDYRLFKNQAEQSMIRLVRLAGASGLSLRQIARQLNDGLVPSKDGGNLEGTHRANDPSQAETSTVYANFSPPR